ncbi:Serine/threonine-protein kinase PknB [Maioricimonas rarisocia]|uniref:non-specific serine/threonine protein kinase n=1 Tax=Maioricimonas rarisocia TaxID=2528026 RepID=A0A517Z0H1_9PLAN|nr:SUMF1/EgtB/PvdO family nonheme iron enzyme [Maioricimonas rarisocia]QDU35982.1 Serine/threonine-protein kinase PknB [Maioricimonas rarisocia]
MGQSGCPDRDTLEQLLLGKLPGEESVELEKHLLDCDDCAEVAETIDARDAVTAAFAQSPELPAADPDVLAHVIERGKQVGSEVETIQSDDTQLVGQPGHDVSVDSTNQANLSAEDISTDEIDFLSPPESPEEIGRLGGYRVLSVLGVGGMGIVFRAEDPKLKRKVALKAMKPAVAASRSARDRFLREAAAAAAIEHDHIVTIYQVGEDRSIPFIAMRYLQGESLQTRIEREGHLSPLEVVRLGRQIASGLTAAHERDLIHRDIKPDNIWLQETTGRAKILDFGLARTTSDESGLTQSGMVLGTPKYMAPEQAEGKPVDHRCDLFSLGSVLYHLLSGKAPFRGGNVTAVLIAVAHRDPEPLASLCPDLPSDLIDLITRLLAKDRSARPATAAEVAETLAAIETQLTSSDASSGTTPATIADPSLVAGPQDEAVAPTIIAAADGAARPPRRRRPLTMWGSFGAVLLAGMITIVTAKGTVTVDIPRPMRDDVEVQILGNGEEVAVLDKENNWTVRLKGGQYALNLTGGDDEFRLEDDTLTVSRFGRSLVRMRYVPTTSVAEMKPPGATAGLSSTADTSGGGWHGWPADAPPPAIAPFDARQGRAHQEAWAKHLGVPVEYENSIGMTFRLIPPGEFLMGSTPEEIEAALKVAGEDEYWRERINSESPQHKVVLTQPLYVSTTQVTQSQYEQVMGTNPSHFSATGEGKELVANLETGNHPVEMVSWNDAAEFCAKLSQQEQLKPFYFRSDQTVTPLDGTGYRLPTEAEWESACRAGTTTRFWSGDEDQNLVSAGWFGSNSGGRTHAAGELKANPFGLSDVHGNVWEWVQDSWDPAFYGKFEEDAAINPFSAGSRRVFRGGGWDCSPSLCRSSIRLADHPSDRYNVIGFRVALAAEAVKGLLSDAPVSRSTSQKPNWHGWPADAPAPAIAPFNAQQARAHQEAWAEYLGVPVEYENSIGMTFRLVPPGEFLMGSSPEEIEAALEVAGADEASQERINSEGPQHKVILTQAVYVGTTEVTQSQYEQVMGTNPSHFSASGDGKDRVADLDTSNHPVEMVSWYDAAEFCAKLSRREKLKPFYFRSGQTVTPLGGNGYRLPTEAEWEHFCRAGTTTRFWIGEGDQDLIQAGWCGSNSGGRTHPVGELKANPFGLHDVHGNLIEWVQDSWNQEFYGQFSDKQAIDPSNPFSPGSRQVRRDGSWYNRPINCRASCRDWHSSWRRESTIGFRVVLAVDAERSQLANATPDATPGLSSTADTSGQGWHGWPADAPAPALAPFVAEQARAHQEAWAKYLGVPVEYTNSIGMTFRLIPPGEFLMGSTPEEIEAALEVAGADEASQERINSEGPQHKVILTQPIYVGVTEVTQSQYEQVVGTNPSHFSASGDGKDRVADLATSNHPVEMVSWYDAAEFCAKLSRREKLKPFYFRSGQTVTPLDGTGYRLPTEAEWEHFCRAGTTTRFWFGNEDVDLPRFDWFQSNSGWRTHVVGDLRKNPFGLRDLGGNVAEWVQDLWSPDFYERFVDVPATNPCCAINLGSHRVIRGGSYQFEAFASRSAFRLGGGNAHMRVGFRVVLPVDAGKRLAKSDQDSEQAPTYALDFDGQDDRVELPLTCDADSPLTVEAVVRIDDWSDNQNGEIVDNTRNGGFSLTVTERGFYFAARIGDRYQQVWVPRDPEYLGHPVALAGVRSGNTLKLYVDGKLIEQETFSGAYSPSPLPITIGSSAGDRESANAAPRDFHGQILAVRISDAVRTAGDLITAEQEGPETDEHTLALYRFDEGAGAVLRDTSGNGHDGTIHGATWVRRPDFALEREVALELFALAETPHIVVLSEEGKRLQVSTGEELPEGPFEVLEIGELHFRDLSGFDFAQFGQLRRLEVLSLNLAANVRPEQLDKLTGLTPLRYLGLHGMPVSDEQLAQILAETPRLEDLGLFWCDQLTDECMPAIARHENLTNLGLPGENLTAAGIAELGRLQNLKQLTLGELPAESGLIAQILTLKKLERLHMRRSAWLGDAELEQLVAHPNLSELSLDESAVSDEALSLLGREDRWRRLELKGTGITDKGLEYLTGLKGLKFLELQRTRTTPEGVKRLKQALSKCRIYTDPTDDQTSQSGNDTSIAPPDPAASPAGEPPSRESLLRILAAVQDCGGRMLIWDDAKKQHIEIRTRQDIPSNLQSGPSLLFKDVESFDDEQLLRVAAACRPFPQHRTLSLDLSGTGVTPAAVGSLSDLPLHVLVLNRNGTIDDGISKALAGFEKLETIGLQQTAISDATITAIAKLESLRVLNLRGTTVTEECLADLARLDLRELDVTRTTIKADGVKKLHEALPGCTIHWDGGVIEPEGVGAER